MKKGMASSEKLSNPDAIFCEITAIAASKGIESIIVSSEAIPIENEIGTPIKSRTKKLELSTIILDHSILFSLII